MLIAIRCYKKVVFSRTWIEIRCTCTKHYIFKANFPSPPNRKGRTIQIRNRGYPILRSEFPILRSEFFIVHSQLTSINDFAHMGPWEDGPPNFPFHPHHSKEIPKHQLLVKFLGAHLPGGPVGEILDSNFLLIQYCFW